MLLNCLLNAPLSVAASLGNALVLAAIWRTPSLHTPSIALLVNLAVSDLCVGSLVQPIYIAYKAAQIQDALRAYCTLGLAFNFLSPLLMSVTLLTLVAISVDRFLAVHLHLRYRQVVRTKRLAVVLGLIWAFSALFASSIYWAVEGHRSLTIALITCSLVVTFLVYFKIFQVVRRHHHQMRKQAFPSGKPVTSGLAQYQKTFVSSLYVFSLLLLCYIPYLSARIASTMAAPRDAAPVYLALNFSATVVYVNSALNPLVYCWRMAEIRLAVVKTARALLGRPKVRRPAPRPQAAGIKPFPHKLKMYILPKF